MVHKRWRWMLAALLGFSLVAAACSKDTSSDKGSGSATTEKVDVPKGGTLTIGAEQEPDCTDWIASCAGSSWGYWMMNVTTMPRAYENTWDGSTADYKATALLDGEPKLETSPKQVVTYKLNPKFTWNDGTPVTSADFKYTWDQIANGEDIYDTTGYSQIESVDASSPETAVVTYKTPYAGWKALFGGGYGILPSHLLEGKDRAAIMKDGYTFSAGPWIIDKWEKGVSVTLVPNPKFDGTKPSLDKVVFKFLTDTAAGFQAIKANEVAMLYPQPQLDAVEQISAGTLTDINSKVNDKTGNIEALWMNNAKPPLDSVAVRQAIAYSLDRNAIVKKLFGGIGVDQAAQALEPALVAQYTDMEAFKGYTKNLDKVKSLMEGDGWKKGADGIWAKGGQKATVEIKSTSGNARRELTEQIVQQQMKEAGFELTIANQKAGDLFGQQLPAGEFQLALYAQVLTTLEPGVCTLFCSKNIPTDANGNVGQNWTRTDIPAIDSDLEQVDTQLDQAKREAAGKTSMQGLAKEVASLPLDPLPNILLWSKKVVGNVQDNPVMGPFYYANTWGVKQ